MSYSMEGNKWPCNGNLRPPDQTLKDFANDPAEWVPWNMADNFFYSTIGGGVGDRETAH